MDNFIFASILKGSVSSIRIIAGATGAKALRDITIRIIETANAMTEEQYIKYDMESKIIELQLIATL